MFLYPIQEFRIQDRVPAHRGVSGVPDISGF